MYWYAAFFIPADTTINGTEGNPIYIAIPVVTQAVNEESETTIHIASYSYTGL